MKTLANIALVALVGCMSIGTAIAGDAASPAGSKGLQQGGVVKSGGTVIQYGAGGTTLNVGFNNVDTAQTLDCKSKKGCTIGVSAMIQLATGSGDWAICAVVDGNYINPGCPYQGSLAAGGASYVTGNSQQSYTVAAGTHTVQTQVYVEESGTLANWQTTQQIYKGE